MLETDTAFAGVAGQADLVRRGDASARELAELALARIERLDPELNAFGAVYPERALAEADAADRRRAAGEDAPLLGVPVGIKDEMDLAGEVTSRGSGANTARAAADAESVRRLRAAGHVMESEDQILFVNTFSKNWAMTGWRMGWITAHPAVGQVIENMIQYSTSGVAQFMQRAGVVALERGEGFVAHQIDRARRGRDIACAALAATGRCRFTVPAGAFYLFFAVEGETDTRTLVLRLIDAAGVGLAPGSAFGTGGERFLRLCFARNAEELEHATSQLAKALASEAG